MQAIALGKNLLWSSTRIYFETFNLRWLYTLCVESTPENVVSYLESYSANLFKWFSNNDIKAHNPEKCHLLMNIKAIEMRKHIISNSYCEKLLGAKIKSQLYFKNYFETIMIKASQNVNAFGYNYALYVYEAKKVNFHPTTIDIQHGLIKQT